MPRNGSGTYSLPQPPFVAGTVISSSAVNSDFSDIATALTGSLPRDGQAGMSGQLKLTDGSSASPSITFTTETTTGFHRTGTGVIGVTLSGVELGTFRSNGWNGPVIGNVTGLGITPVGGMIDFAGASAPTGWLLCFGQAISRTTYSALFAVIGTTYGVGDGSTTFNLPDLRGLTSFGVDNMGGVARGKLTSTYYGANPDSLGVTGGTQTQTLITLNLPPYTPAGTPGLSSFSGTSNNSSVSGGGTNSITTGGFSGTGSFTFTSISATMSFTGTAQGGTSTPFGIVPPGITLNKIIYVGV